MKSNSKWNWMVALAVVAIFTFTTGNALAWGPLAQSAIANEVQNTQGVPMATSSPFFVIESTMPKVFEYSDSSYANLSYDYTDIMMDNLHGPNHFCQALAWGTAVTAEKTGDENLFYNISANTYERWFHELMCDAILRDGDTNYQTIAQVAVMPKLVSDASDQYVAIYGGDAIGGLDAVLSAHFQANVLIGELAVFTSEAFNTNSKQIINSADLVLAMDKSVENAVDFVINSTQAGTQSDWLVGDASAYGSQLLGKIGNLLVATGDAVIASQNSQGIYYYRVDLASARVNEITTTFLANLARDLREDPIMRYMARTLLDLMTEEDVNELDFNKIYDVKG